MMKNYFYCPRESENWVRELNYGWIVNIVACFSWYLLFFVDVGVIAVDDGWDDDYCDDSNEYYSTIIDFGMVGHHV